MTGVNIFLEYLTEERVSKVHNDGSLIGLWYVKARHTEDAAMWEKAFTFDGGIDFFYSDMPLAAMEYRNSH